MQVVLNSVLLQGAGGLQGAQGIILMVGMFAVMYFFMLRPQAKRAKEQKKFTETMNAGEFVITTAGIHGTIQRANEDGTLQLEIARGVFVKIERAAVSMETTVAYRKKQDATSGAVAAKA